MVCFATLDPAAPAADATGFALVNRYLAGRVAALPEGCVLDVELEAKELLARFLPAGRAAVEEAYRGMRAELARRPTPTELLHAHYLPPTLRATHGSWSGFCRAEGDLDASEDRVVERFRAWLGMLETTSLNKSYKLVVLRVLLDRDALWDWLEIPRLAAACRSFLENHPTLRADLEGAAFTRAPGDGRKWGLTPSDSEVHVPFSADAPIAFDLEPAVDLIVVREFARFVRRTPNDPGAHGSGGAAGSPSNTIRRTELPRRNWRLPLSSTATARLSSTPMNSTRPQYGDDQGGKKYRS